MTVASNSSNVSDVVYLADHPIWIAVPAFAPAFVVAGVVIYIAVRNRRKGGGGTGSPNTEGKP
ncbi:MAG: hypothetical protein K2X52_27195 [Mycobacteriaceae bacterium]|nr:hypothetical protein [Mycobacteriaceae bacterium]